MLECCGVARGHTRGREGREGKDNCLSYVPVEPVLHSTHSLHMPVHQATRYSTLLYMYMALISSRTLILGEWLIPIARSMGSM